MAKFGKRFKLVDGKKVPMKKVSTGGKTFRFMTSSEEKRFKQRLSDRRD